MTTEFHAIEVKTIDGSKHLMELYKGKYLLIVNLASKCGFTPQYEGLEKLYTTYSGYGFTILGFPCNQFGGQEPGTEKEIQEFCTLNFGVTFPLYAKVDVNGNDAHPLFIHLKKECPGTLGTEAIKWNFTKFLVDPDGKVLKRFAPVKTPSALDKVLDEILK